MTEREEAPRWTNRVGYPRQLEFDLGEIDERQPGDEWRHTSPSRWTKAEARAYHRRARAAQRGDGQAQRDCLAWLDVMLHQPIE